MKCKILIVAVVLCFVYVVVSVSYIHSLNSKLSHYDKYYEVVNRILECWETTDEDSFGEWISGMEYCDYYHVCKLLGKDAYTCDKDATEESTEESAEDDLTCYRGVEL